MVNTVNDHNNINTKRKENAMEKIKGWVNKYCTMYLDCDSEEEQEQSNLDFGYYGMMVVFALAIMRWGGIL